MTLEELLNLVKDELKENENNSSELKEGIYIHDDRHLKVLNKGSKLWNRWINKNAIADYGSVEAQSTIYSAFPFCLP